SLRNEQAEKMQSMLGKANDQHDRETDNRKHAGHCQVAGYCERMQAKNTNGEKPQHVGKKNEHKQREDIRRVFLASGSNIGVDHIVDKACKAFNHQLPAAGNEITLHSATHEQEQHEHCKAHPDSTIGQTNLLTT